MPDISMCRNKLCEQRKGCYRHTATPNPYRQAYASFKPVNGVCEYYLPNTDIKENTIWKT